MRCFFMRDGHISSVEMLHEDNDAALIAKAKSLFVEQAKARNADGFEVWAGPRFIYRFPEAANP